MKLTLFLPLLTLADAALNAAPTNGWFGGRSGLALVVKGNKKSGFTYATRDGGDESASFYGTAPKGGALLRDAADCAKEAVDFRSKKDDVKVNGGSNGDEEGRSFHIGPFLESKLFKEGGLGFLFGGGTAYCVRKVNRNAAYAVGGACVAAQYLSRSDFLGCGGKLGWPKLNCDELRDSDRENFPCLWRAGRMFKDTVAQSLPTVEGYVVGLAAGLKAPLP